MSPNTVPNANLQIQKVRRTRQAIFVSFKHGSDEQTLKCHENPLPPFNSALDALPPLVCAICGLPASYTEKMTATGLTIAGSDESVLVMIIAKKDLPDNNRPFNIATPLRLLYQLEAKPGAEHEPGPVAVPLAKEMIHLIENVLSEAKRYVLGERAQGTMNFEGGEEEGADAEGSKA